MTNQDKLQTLNGLNDLAKSLRGRQEAIEAKLHRFRELTADLLADGVDQGRELVLAKTKLGKAIRWSDWLRAHVPNVSETQAAKYERLAVEQITDLRQAVFAFLPPNEAQAEGNANRLPPAAWETYWGYIQKLERVSFDSWPAEQTTATKDRLAMLVEKLGGKVSW